jgi:hypothetical protein
MLQFDALPRADEQPGQRLPSGKRGKSGVEAAPSANRLINGVAASIGEPIRAAIRAGF